MRWNPNDAQFGDLEVVYVVFDILYLDTGSVINRTLTERQELLRQTLAPQQEEAITVGVTPLAAHSAAQVTFPAAMRLI
jgi:ATP-dependent DNA ligase